MTSQYRTRAGLAAALAVASLTAAAPAGADPNPAQRVQLSERGAALAQEQYYMSHKPAIPATGHDFRTIDARDSARATEAALAREQYYGSHPSAISTPKHATRTIEPRAPSGSCSPWPAAQRRSLAAIGPLLPDVPGDPEGGASRPRRVVCADAHRSPRRSRHGSPGSPPNPRGYVSITMPSDVRVDAWEGAVIEEYDPLLHLQHRRLLRVVEHVGDPECPVSMGSSNCDLPTLTSRFP
jgi:hypothetical protein